SSCYTSNLFMLSIDQKIATPHISTFISAICMMFGSYYCFNIHYSLGLGSTLGFMQ
ncbi:Interferon-induced 44, partial [Clarias magur]